MVSLDEVTPSLLASLSSKDDIFSLVVAHTEHAHGETTELDYKFAEAEHDAKHRFVGARKRIGISNDKIPFYMFQEDFNLWNQMETLSASQVRA